LSEISISRLQTQGVIECAAAIARGELSPMDVLEATLERIVAIDGSVRAWSYLDIDGARAEAKRLTGLAVDKEFLGPLHGVPVGIKDEFHVRGMPTGMRDQTPAIAEEHDSAVVARLREAGAIILGKTFMPIGRELPPTRNPWNLEHTAGGTSSGSGAAVGARMVPFAVGEQTMGSNLRPAAYCGVAAIKPTYGRISRFGCMPFAWSLDHVGLIGLSFADLALVLSVVAGPDMRDPTTLPDPPPPADLALKDFPPPRIGVVRNFFPDRYEKIMLDEVETAAGRLAGAGASVGEVLLPSEFEFTWSADRVVSAAEGATAHAHHHDERDFSGSAGRSGALIPATYYLEARRFRSWLQTLLHEQVFTRYDAILMATTPGPAPRASSTGNANLLVPWSFLGLPAINVPSGFSPAGLPLGLQLVSDRREDYRLLRVGAWCEGVLGRLPAPTIEYL
jgi:aspartyl-tRNA(Asn)/glutamyl-tRNA(Gln) amidotransferase subunit A